MRAARRFTGAATGSALGVGGVTRSADASTTGAVRIGGWFVTWAGVLTGCAPAPAASAIAETMITKRVCMTFANTPA